LDGAGDRQFNAKHGGRPSESCAARGDRVIAICEVGPRDGLQNEPIVLMPAQRAALVARLMRAGLRRIEVGSFVDPRRVPAMAGVEELLELVTVPDDVTLTALALNVRGYERLARTALTEVRFAFGASETFNERNAGRSVDASLREAEEVVRRAHADGRRASVTIATAFGCPYEGGVDPAHVVALAERIAAAGADELVLADTIGVAVPSQVRGLLGAVAGLGPVPGIHLHNTRNTGYANVVAALESGVEVIDASVGGAGGCPFAPGATGNVATEDVAYLLEREGVRTGIDLDALAETARWLGATLGHELDGRLSRAGTWWPAGAGDVAVDGAPVSATAAADGGSARAGVVDPHVFRDAIGRFLTGVTIITAHDGDEDYATTASAVASLSLEPPMLLACLNTTSDTRAAILASRRFAVNVLAHDQEELARRCAGKGHGKLADVALAHGVTGAPLIAGALVQLECRVASIANGGTHTVFLAEVTSARAREGAPLAYFRGGFGRLAGDHHDLGRLADAAAARAARPPALAGRAPTTGGSA
jgi:isopropylmalate/homocitrate/citramalate synthase/flavin reductase (DIM6/NTAB) family NADH-FMN oxidoreductase RutF